MIKDKTRHDSAFQRLSDKADTVSGVQRTDRIYQELETDVICMVDTCYGESWKLWNHRYRRRPQVHEKMFFQAALESRSAGSGLRTGGKMRRTVQSPYFKESALHPRREPGIQDFCHRSLGHRYGRAGSFEADGIVPTEPTGSCRTFRRTHRKPMGQRYSRQRRLRDFRLELGHVDHLLESPAAKDFRR